MIATILMPETRSPAAKVSIPPQAVKFSNISGITKGAMHFPIQNISNRDANIGAGTAVTANRRLTAKISAVIISSADFAKRIEWSPLMASTNVP